MVAPPDSRQSASKANPNQDLLRWIILPIVGVGALVLAGTISVLLLPERLQVSLIADWLVSVMLLCPLAICLFPVCLLMVLAIVGMNRAHTAASRPLQRVELLSASLRDRTDNVADTVNRQTINASVRFAFLDRLLAIFDPPDSQPDTGAKEE